jgi:hypothetical protein
LKNSKALPMWILNNFVPVLVFYASKSPQTGVRDFCHAYTLISGGLQTL